ncbi:MAG: hypothetical protein U0Q11_18915 [Vicinamibacterales bacterium]
MDTSRSPCHQDDERLPPLVFHHQRLDDGVFVHAEGARRDRGATHALRSDIVFREVHAVLLQGALCGPSSLHPNWCLASTRLYCRHDARIGRCSHATLAHLLDCCRRGFVDDRSCRRAKAGCCAAASRRADLQGVWDTGTATPLTRPAPFATKSHFTSEEAAAFERDNETRILSVFSPEDRLASDLNDIYQETVSLKVTDDLRTSLIIDPPNGQLPGQLPMKARADARPKRTFDDPETRRSMSDV